MIGLIYRPNLLKQCCALCPQQFFCLQSRTNCIASLVSSEKINFAKVFNGKILNLLAERRFLDVSSNGDVTISLLGKEVMCNINSEWNRCALKKGAVKLIEGDIPRGKYVQRLMLVG